MLIRLLEDLRFFIGAFFVIVGVLLMGQGLLHPEEIAGHNMNLIVGTAFVIFGAGALGMALSALKKS